MMMPVFADEPHDVESDGEGVAAMPDVDMSPEALVAKLSVAPERLATCTVAWRRTIHNVWALAVPEPFVGRDCVQLLWWDAVQRPCEAVT